MIGNRMADPPAWSWWLIPAYAYLVATIANGLVAVVGLARVVIVAGLGGGWDGSAALVAAWAGLTALLMALMDDEGVRVEEQREELVNNGG